MFVVPTIRSTFVHFHKIWKQNIEIFRFKSRSSVTRRQIFYTNFDSYDKKRAMGEEKMAPNPNRRAKIHVDDNSQQCPSFREN